MPPSCRRSSSYGASLSKSTACCSTRGSISPERQGGFGRGLPDGRSDRLRRLCTRHCVLASNDEGRHAGDAERLQLSLEASKAPRLFLVGPVALEPRRIQAAGERDFLQHAGITGVARLLEIGAEQCLDDLRADALLLREVDRLMRGKGVWRALHAREGEFDSLAASLRRHPGVELGGTLDRTELRAPVRGARHA